jgi:hypothetical protein
MGGVTAATILWIGLLPMKTEKFDGHHGGWRTLWLAIAGVMAIMLTWNVLMLKA